MTVNPIKHAHGFVGVCYIVKLDAYRWQLYSIIPKGYISGIDINDCPGTEHIEEFRKIEVTLSGTL